MINKNSNQQGFSLLEMLVAIVLFMIVTASIYGLLQVSRIERNRASRQADVLKNARVAMHLIGRDAFNAGLGFNRAGAVVPDNFVHTRLGLVPEHPSNTARDLLTSVVGGNDRFPNNLGGPTAPTDSIAFCFRDMDFNPDSTLPAADQVGRLVNLTDVTSPVDPATPRILREAQTGAAAAAVHHLYLVESDTTQLAVMATQVSGTAWVDAGVGDPLGVNQPLNGAGSNGSVLRECVDADDENCTTYIATMKRFFFVNYRVNPDGVLIRTTYGNNVGGPNTLAGQSVEQPLAYNIEDLQIEYVLEDGTVTAEPNAGPDLTVGTADDFPEGFNQVRQITVTLRVQAGENDEQTGRPSTLTLTSTFSARNMEYEAG